MAKQPRGFMAFRFPHDAERYCNSGDEDAKAVRALWDASVAAYVTEIADFTIIERFPNKPCVKIENDGLWPWPVYISADIAERMRWRRVSEDDYTARDWIEAAFAAWRDDELPLIDERLRRAILARDASPPQIAKALLLRATVVEVLERPEEALALLNEIEARFGMSEDSEVRAYVAEAMYDRGSLHVREGRMNDAIASFDAVIVRFCHDKDPEVGEQVAKARQALIAGVKSRRD